VRSSGASARVKLDFRQEATLYLLERGVRVTGIDAWTRAAATIEA